MQHLSECILMEESHCMNIREWIIVCTHQSRLCLSPVAWKGCYPIVWRAPNVSDNNRNQRQNKLGENEYVHGQRKMCAQRAQTHTKTIITIPWSCCKQRSRWGERCMLRWTELKVRCCLCSRCTWFLGVNAATKTDVSVNYDLNPPPPKNADGKRIKWNEWEGFGERCTRKGPDR